MIQPHLIKILVCLTLTILTSSSLAQTDAKLQDPIARSGEFIVSVTGSNFLAGFASKNAGQPTLAQTGTPIRAISDQDLFVRVVDLAAAGEPSLASGNAETRLDDIRDGIAAQFEISPEEVRVTPNYIGRLAVEPNDEKFFIQREYLESLSFPEAWDRVSEATGVIVAVLDSGSMYSHEDLAGNVWRNQNESLDGQDNDGNGYIDDIYGYDFYEDSPDPGPRFIPVNRSMRSDGRCVDPESTGFILKQQEQHGTRVASIAGAVGNNQLGMTGASWKVDVMLLRVAEHGVNCNAVALSAVIRAIRYAVSMGATVINASWYGFPKNEPLERALRFAQQNGVLVVAAAGNSSTDLDQSPSYPQNSTASNVLVVSSLDSSGDLSSFSNFGKDTVDLAAPGESIFAAHPRPMYPELQSRYSMDSGTSFSAPLVSGVAALLMAESPSLTPERVIEILVETSTPAASLSGQLRSGGIVNVAAAMNRLSAGPSVSLAGLQVSVPKLVEFEGRLRALPESERSDIEAIERLLPEIQQLTEQGRKELLSDIATQLVSSSEARASAKEDKSSSIVVEVSPAAEKVPLEQFLKNSGAEDFRKLDDKTYEVLIADPLKAESAVNILKNNPMILKAYPTPMGQLEKGTQ